MKRRGNDCLEIRRLRRDRVLRRLVARRRRQGIGIGIQGTRVVVLVVVDVEEIEATAVETTTATILAKSGILKAVQRISSDSCMIRVIRLSRVCNAERRRVLRNERMVNSRLYDLRGILEILMEADVVGLGLVLVGEVLCCPEILLLRVFLEWNAKREIKRHKTMVWYLCSSIRGGIYS
jgi:hypothetical protein